MQKALVAYPLQHCSSKALRLR